MKRNILMFIKEMPVTLAIILINIVVFIICQVSDAQLLHDYGLIGIDVKNGEYYRILTCLFLHEGIYHILCNMFVLSYMGWVLERYAGHFKMALIYLLSGISGSVLVVLVEDEFILSIGASGAIFGITGAILVYMIKAQNFSNIRSLVIGIALNMIVSFSEEGISIGGHLGGLIGGFVIGWLIIRPDRQKIK